MKCVNDHCPFNSDEANDGCLIIPEDMIDNMAGECPKKIVVARGDLSKEIKALKDGLKDSNIVWANMLRGTIAKPQRLEYLEDKVLRVVRGEFGQICSYCGAEFKADGWEELQEHIKTCPKHPLTKANAVIAELEADKELDGRRILNAFQLIKNGVGIGYLKFGDFKNMLDMERDCHGRIVDAARKQSTIRREP